MNYLFIIEFFVSDENRDSRSLLPGDTGHHHGHDHEHEDEHHHGEHHAEGHVNNAHHEHEHQDHVEHQNDSGSSIAVPAFQQRRAPTDSLGLAAGSTQRVTAGPRVATSAAVVPAQEAVAVQQPSGGLGIAQQPRSGKRLQSGSGNNLNGNGLDGDQPRSYQFEYKV